jgi:predicted metalloendopeptidase
MHLYLENKIYVSAAILQPPFLDVNQPASVNYGNIGAAIGHEFTHGFDSTGADFDLAGKSRPSINT